jgi:hypothetical protein
MPANSSLSNGFDERGMIMRFYPHLPIPMPQEAEPIKIEKITKNDLNYYVMHLGLIEDLDSDSWKDSNKKENYLSPSFFTKDIPHFIIYRKDFEEYITQMSLMFFEWFRKARKEINNAKTDGFKTTIKRVYEEITEFQDSIYNQRVCEGLKKTADNLEKISTAVLELIGEGSTDKGLELKKIIKEENKKNHKTKRRTYPKSKS